MKRVKDTLTKTVVHLHHITGCTFYNRLTDLTAYIVFDNKKFLTTSYWSLENNSKFIPNLL